MLVTLQISDHFGIRNLDAEGLAPSRRRDMRVDGWDVLPDRVCQAARLRAAQLRARGLAPELWPLLDEIAAGDRGDGGLHPSSPWWGQETAWVYIGSAGRVLRGRED
jgi:hypothetical protein